MIRVLLAEDHGLVRAGLERLLATVADVEVVGSAADGAEAVELAAETAARRRPDGPVDADVDGIDGDKADPRRGRAAQVVMLTSVSDRERILPRSTPARSATC